jgi:hypothetical protein
MNEVSCILFIDKYSCPPGQVIPHARIQGDGAWMDVVPNYTLVEGEIFLQYMHGLGFGVFFG